MVQTTILKNPYKRSLSNFPKLRALSLLVCNGHPGCDINDRAFQDDAIPESFRLCPKLQYLLLRKATQSLALESYTRLSNTYGESQGGLVPGLKVEEC